MKKLLFSIFFIFSPIKSSYWNLYLRKAINDWNVGNVAKALENGANVNAIDDRKEAFKPLIFAINHGKKKMTMDSVMPYNLYCSNKFTIIELLVKAGANVNDTDENFNSPLILLVTDHVDLKIAQLLIRYGADIDYKNEEDKTAIGIARDRLYSHVVNFLETSRSENIAKRKQKIKEEVAKYISTGPHGPLQYILQYAEEYVPTFIEQSHEEVKEAQEIVWFV